MKFLRISNIINKLYSWMPLVNHADHPPKTVSTASATASSEPSAVRKGRRPPPPPERINLDVAQIMGWYRGNPPWSLRKIAKKLHANRGTILARIREYEAIEKEFKAAAEALKAKTAAAAQPKDSPRTAYVPDWIPPTQPLINPPQQPPTSKPVTPAVPAPPPATPAAVAPNVQPLEEGIGDWSVGFGYGTGCGVRWTAPEPPSREGAGGLAGVDDGDDWK